MPQDVIAIICDCDGTLCPDTTDLLVRELGLDSADFWKRQVGDLVRDGWDPPLAYLNELLKVSQRPDVANLTKSRLRAVGEAVQFFPEALGFIPRLREMLAENREYLEANVSIEWYIVSGGIEAVLRATPLQERATEIFGCEFAFNSDHQAVSVKRAVTFTEKTKFIYAINKGISGAELRRDPFRVNDFMESEDRRVPFQHMIYVGDGPTDIPCFSMIKYLGGKAIGVMAPDETELKKPYELAEGNRLTVGPYTADYSEGTDLYKILARIVTGIADSILEKREQRIRRAPTH